MARYNGGWVQGYDGNRHYGDGSVGGNKPSGYLTALENYGTADPNIIALKEQERIQREREELAFQQKQELDFQKQADESRNLRLGLGLNGLPQTLDQKLMDPSSDAYTDAAGPRESAGSLGFSMSAQPGTPAPAMKSIGLLKPQPRVVKTEYSDAQKAMRTEKFQPDYSATGRDTPESKMERERYRTEQRRKVEIFKSRIANGDDPKVAMSIFDEPDDADVSDAPETPKPSATQPASAPADAHSVQALDPEIEKKIAVDMKHYGKKREEVIEAYKNKGIL